jgi:nitrite reductase/ring-hydroxylating ferredoxin subunit
LEFDLETGEALFGHRVRLAPVEVELVDGSIVMSIAREDFR